MIFDISGNINITAITAEINGKNIPLEASQMQKDQQKTGTINHWMINITNLKGY